MSITALGVGTDYRTALGVGTDYRTALGVGTDYRTALGVGTDYRTALGVGTDYRTLQIFVTKKFCESLAKWAAKPFANNIAQVSLPDCTILKWHQTLNTMN